MTPIGRSRRTRILVEGSAELRGRLAQQIMDSYDVIEVEAPDHGLVMTKMRETARRSLFYLGEVLVTESKVQIGESVGLGIIAGDDRRAARELAVIDAAFRVPLPETEGWAEALLEEERRVDALVEAHEAKLLETRVTFDTMETE